MVSFGSSNRWHRLPSKRAVEIQPCQAHKASLHLLWYLALAGTDLDCRDHVECIAFLQHPYPCTRGAIKAFSQHRSQAQASLTVLLVL